jgi:hypothetical protein
MGLFGSLLAVLIYMLAGKITGKDDFSLFIALAFVLTAPVFFLSIHVYPEIQVLLLLLAALYLLFYSGERTPIKLTTAGFLLGMTIFWGLKYAIFIYLYSLGLAVFFILKKQGRNALWFILFPLVFQVLFFGYLYSAYGTFSPGAVYQGIHGQLPRNSYWNTLFHKIPLQNRVETMLDYFFDQRDGLLPYNPLYLFAFPGFLIAVKKIKKYRSYLLVSLPAFAYLGYHAFSTIRAGYCPQGRYLVPVLWVMLLLIIIYYRETPNRLNKKFLLAVPVFSLFTVVYQVLHPLTLYQPTTHGITQRAGLLFTGWSNSVINLPALLPSYVKIPGNLQHPPNIVFLFLLLLFTVFSLVKIRYSRLTPVTCFSFLVLFTLFCLFPLSS